MRIVTIMITFMMETLTTSTVMTMKIIIIITIITVIMSIIKIVIFNVAIAIVIVLNVKHQILSAPFITYSPKAK